MLRESTDDLYGFFNFGILKRLEMTGFLDLSLLRDSIGDLKWLEMTGFEMTGFLDLSLLRDSMGDLKWLPQLWYT